MDWILIGIVAGSLVTSSFATKEACLGRVATLSELKIPTKCVEAPGRSAWTSGSIITLDPNSLVCHNNVC